METETNNPGGGGGAWSAAGNRWPQEETMALLNIRLEMHAAFRDAGVKAPLWDEVSRRLAQHGYNRSAAKCKEKFENLYKYHKRTKHNRLSRSNAKSYRFFDQLEALDHQEYSSDKPNPINTVTRNSPAPLFISPINSAPAVQTPMANSIQFPAHNLDFSTSSSSGDECEGSRKRKRKWQEFFSSIMKIVLEKQEDLHRKFLEALDRCESERMAREESWKSQEMARIKREQELLERERLIAATKDAAVIAFLQKISEQGKFLVPENLNVEEKSVGDEDNGEANHFHGNSMHAGISRWPEEEVNALIKVRTDMELKYHGDGPKGLWEEISACMKKLGYDRNAKRCKEKWENINKYYRKVKESNKKRPMDSKTCSYFQQLETLYQIKAQNADNSSENNLKPEELLMHIMNHSREQDMQQQRLSMVGQEASENVDRMQDDEYDDEDYDEEAEHQIGTSVRSILA